MDTIDGFFEREPASFVWPAYCNTNQTTRYFISIYYLNWLLPFYHLALSQWCRYETNAFSQLYTLVYTRLYPYVNIAIQVNILYLILFIYFCLLLFDFITAILSLSQWCGLSVHLSIQADILTEVYLYTLIKLLMFFCIIKDSTNGEQQTGNNKSIAGPLMSQFNVQSESSKASSV